jgi:hypothetical protein
VKDVTGYSLPLKRFEHAPEPRPPLEITVVAATAEEVGTTLTALARLWRGLNATVTVLLPVVVQFPAPLTASPVSSGFLERQLRSAVAGHSAARIEVTILLCRDPIEAIRGALKPRSVIVIGKRRWRWPNARASLARALEKAGHCVVYAR